MWAESVCSNARLIECKVAGPLARCAVVACKAVRAIGLAGAAKGLAEFFQQQMMLVHILS